MTDLMKPIVSINGTTRRSLVEQRLEAMRGIDGAMKALVETCPHGRDYIGHPDRFAADRAVYQARFALLDKLRNEIQDEALAIQEGG